MWADKESSIDYLNFSEISESIADIVNTPELLPVSIGIFGDWGAGKSTILNLTQKEITKTSPEFMHIEFDAWLYQGYDDARASILETIANELVTQTKKDASLNNKAKSFLQRVDKVRALGVAADIGSTALGIPTFGAFGKLLSVAQDHLSSDEEDGSSEPIDITAKDITNAVSSSKGLIKAARDKSPPQEIREFREEYSSLITEIGKPIVVYVDNLDRCTPLNAIQTLEAIRLFLFLPNTAFLIAADEDMIRTAVSEYHKGATSRHQTDYLDKLIQVPISVPKPGILEVRAYLYMLIATQFYLSQQNLIVMRESLEDSLRNSWRSSPCTLDELLDSLQDVPTDRISELKLQLQTADRMATILATSPRINGNPRIVKRLLNVVKMRKNVSDRRQMNLEESLITKLVIFERCAGKAATIELYQLIDKEQGKPSIFSDLEEKENDAVELPKAWEPLQEFIKTWAQLPPALSNIDLRAAAYLSRETIPMGHINNSLSPSANSLLSILLETKTLQSKATKTAIHETPSEDYLAVMEGVIDALRKTSDWNRKPPGVDGAILLSREDDDAKKILYQYLSGLKERMPWLSVIIKELNK